MDVTRADWAARAAPNVGPSRGGDVIQAIERAIPTAEVDRSELPV